MNRLYHQLPLPPHAGDIRGSQRGAAIWGLQSSGKEPFLFPSPPHVVRKEKYFSFSKLRITCEVLVPEPTPTQNEVLLTIISGVAEGQVQWKAKHCF